MNNDKDCQIHWEKHLQVFCLIKLCLYTRVACLVRTIVSSFKSYKIRDYHRKQSSKHISLHSMLLKMQKGEQDLKCKIPYSKFDFQI